MTTVPHQLYISGPEARADAVSARVLRELLAVVVDGAERALRLRVEGRSTAPGTAPRWVAQGAAFDVVAGANAQEWQFIGRSLAEAAPDKFGQADLFDELDVQQSALDLFEEGLQDAVAGKEDSDRFDDGLIQVFLRLAGIFDHRVQSMRLLNGRDLSLGHEEMERIESLRIRTPAPQAVRIAGKVESIRHSDRMFLLVLESGERLRGVADAVDEAHLRSTWGKLAVVSGKAAFRPSGRPLRVEAERITLAEPRDAELWSRLPKPSLSPLDTRALRQPQGPRSGINAVWGQWPGDESDEQMSEALRRLS